jgi:hypothetical protein
MSPIAKKSLLLLTLCAIVGTVAVTVDTARAGGDGCETGHRTDWERV